MQGRAWWIRLPDGSRRRLGAGGVLVGREPDCDIVLRDPTASRRQVMLYVAAEGPQVVPLGRGPTTLAGQPLAAPSAVEDGHEVVVPGLTLVVEAEPLPAEEPADAVWVLERVGGGLFGVGAQGVSVGSGPGDDVRVEGCPAGALDLRVAQGRLVLEANVDVQLREETLAAGTVEALRSGDTLRIGAVTVRVVARNQSALETTVGSHDHDDESLPSRVSLTFLPRGGRLSLAVGGREYTAYVADRRCDLVACLLRPPAPFTAGDAIPDRVLIHSLWPRRGVTVSAFNVLLHRLRKDLVRAGVDGSEIIARAPGASAVRFSLRRGALVEVH